MSASKSLNQDQLQLPGVSNWEEEARRSAVKKFQVHSYDPTVNKKKVTNFVHKALMGTKMPSTMLSKLSDVHTSFTPVDNPRWAGEYFPQGNTVAYNTKQNVMNDDFSMWNTHELGHAMDHKTTGGKHVEFLSEERRAPKDGGMWSPDPRLEGVADGFMDRYSTGTTGFKHQTSSSYGKGVSSWSPAETAVYHATRAHTARTGEHIASDYSGEHPEGEFLHKLSGRGSHVMEALKNSGLGDIARQEMDKWKSTTKTGTQLSLFGDTDYDTYYTPVSHMGPQFGK